MMEQMTETRFAMLAEAYGGEIARWPDADQASARALLETSVVARRALEDAKALDALLDADPVPAPGPDFMARILSDAAEVAAEQPRTEQQAARTAAKSTGALGRFLEAVFGGDAWRPAMAATACALIGFAAGFGGLAADFTATDSSDFLEVAYFETTETAFDAGLDLIGVQ